VLRVEDDWRLYAGSQVAGRLAERLDLFAVAADVTVGNLDETHRLFHLEGPSTVDAARDLLSDGFATERTAAGRVAWEGETLEYARRSLFGEIGLTLLVPAARSARFQTEVARIGRVHDLLPAGHDERQTLRIEAGRPEGGVDVDDNDLLQAAGLLEAISLEKGCYPGQEILQRIAQQGSLKRRLSGIRMLDPGSPAETVPAPEFQILSSAVSSRVGEIALAWLPARHAAAGRKLRVDAEQRAIVVEVCELPFVNGPMGPLPEVPRIREGKQQSA
jgi:folate-binding protein YgfZ